MYSFSIIRLLITTLVREVWVELQLVSLRQQCFPTMSAFEPLVFSRIYSTYYALSHEQKDIRKKTHKTFVNHSSVVFSYSTLAVILWGAQPLVGNHCSAAPCCAVC